MVFLPNLYIELLVHVVVLAVAVAVAAVVVVVVAFVLVVVVAASVLVMVAAVLAFVGIVLVHIVVHSSYCKKVVRGNLGILNIDMVVEKPYMVNKS
jgi:hypothetical protein